MQQYLIKKAIELALPYVIKFIFERLLSDDQKQRVEKGEELVDKDIKEVLDRIDKDEGSHQEGTAIV
jgi:uncharacterized protein with von Willebrand factor type A (vWA) domain